MFKWLASLFKRKQPEHKLSISERMAARDMYDGAFAAPLRTSKARSSSPARHATSSRNQPDDVLSNPLNPMNPIGFNSPVYYDSTSSYSSSSSCDSSSYDSGSSYSSSDSSSSSCSSSSGGD